MLLVVLAGLTLTATTAVVKAEGPAINHRFFLELPNGAKMPLPGAKIHTASTSKEADENLSFISNQCRYNIPEEDTGGLRTEGKLANDCEYGDKGCHMCQTGNSCFSDDYGAPYLPKSFNSAEKIYDKASHDASYSFFKNETFTSALNTNFSAISSSYTPNNLRGFANARWRGEIDRNNQAEIDGQIYYSLSMVDTDPSYERFTQFLRDRTDKNTGQNLLDAWRDQVGQPGQITDPSRWEKGEIFRKALGGNILHGEITWILSVTPPEVPQIACLSTTLTPATATVGTTQDFTVTCGRVETAVKYKLKLKENTAAATETVVGIAQPATGNPTHTFKADKLPAGSYEVSCTPCTSADMIDSSCAPIIASCKAPFALTPSVASGSATCREKTAYIMNGTTRTPLQSGTSTVAASYVDPGKEFYYDIVVAATKLTSAPVTVTDTLPTQLEFVNAKLGTGAVVTAPAAGTFFTAKVESATDTKLTFVIPAFGSAATATVPETRTITLKVKVKATATPGTFTNSATVATGTTAGNTCANTLRVPNAGAATCVAKEAYLMNGETVGEKIAEGATVPAGTTILYKIMLNAAAQTAGSVVITDQLPAGLTHVDAGDFTFTAATRTYTKTIESFVGNQTASFTARINADASTGTIRNSATVVTKDRDGVALDTGDSCAVSIAVPAFSCNSNCTSTSQCQSSNADFICSAGNNNRCRIKDNESSENCQPKTFA